jgi:cell division GTPase FtsZ
MTDITGIRELRARIVVCGVGGAGGNASVICMNKLSGP